LPPAADEDHLDVFFAPAYTAPLSLSAPIVVTIHDLSYVAHPEWFRLREGMRRRWVTRHTAARARTVITVSEFSRGEIVERLNVSGERVRVIPQGIDAPAVSTAARTEPRVLYVGSIFNRRHLPDLVRAFASLARLRSDASLDIVGDNRSYPHQDVNAVIDREGLGGRIRWHRYVSDEQLRDLYARAGAFAFLSEYEGLGMTPLEALAAGAPSVLLDTPVARESCGEAALYVELGSLATIAQALERLLFDEETRARLLSAAPGVLAKYSWPRAARETLAVLEQSAATS
jgi:glycosyltransferase involved in cell wall biosynthesis